jgi:peroxisomal 2,4-dienoyl-CoA reductase
MSRQLGLHGCKVVIMGRRQNVLDDAIQAMSKEGIEAAAFQGDVRNDSDASNAVKFVRERFGGLDTLVNGAAGNFLANAAELAPKVTAICILSSPTACISNALCFLLTRDMRTRGGA